MLERRLISFTVGSYRFAVPIETVREVLDVASLVPVPGGRLPLEGILSYRGNMVLPVFSLLDLLGTRHDETGNFVIVTGPVDDPVGFRVRHMGGVITSGEKDEITPLEGESSLTSDAIAGVLKKTGGEMILLEMDLLF
ncbi:MAG: chemotaxis protein CheW [bacterium]|nr:chemotaxis protein CheW [bacterium]MDT8366052.1 chemotaxis protein CheW [bacterium]